MIMNGKQVHCILLGASAGGVEVLSAFFSSLKKPLPIPVVVTLHVPPHTDFVENVYRTHADIIIKEAEDKEDLKPGTIYFAPSDYHLLLEQDGSVSLSSEEQVCYSRPSIDVMFESSVSAYGGNVLGILVSGANEDGAAGLKKIHDAGGQTWVQNPKEARASTMPEAALALFSPDRIVSVSEIGKLIYG